ncbi:hypothetical protein AAZX31_10G056500 [Glycine max]
MLKKFKWLGRITGNPWPIPSKGPPTKIFAPTMNPITIGAITSKLRFFTIIPVRAGGEFEEQASDNGAEDLGDPE